MARPQRFLAFALCLCACSGAQTPPPGTPPKPSPAKPTPVANKSPQPVKPVAPTPPATAPAPRRHPGALVLDGTPRLPARHPVQRYMNMRSASASDISDNGKRMLITTRFGEVAQVHLVDRPMGARTQITFSKEPVRGARFVPGRTDAIYFTGDIGGSEQNQIYRMDLATMHTTLLTDGKSRNGYPVMSRNGKRMAFHSTRRNKRDFDIWISDGKSAASAKLLRKMSGAWYPLEFSRDGKRLLVAHYVSAAHSSIHVIEVASGKMTRITPAKPVASYSSATFKRDGRSVYLTTDRFGEFHELYEVSADGKKWRSLTKNIPWNVGNVSVSGSGGLVAFTTNENGWSVLRVMNAYTRRLLPAAKLPRGVISGLEFARKTNVLRFTLRSGTRPGDAYAYNVYGRRVRRWTNSEVGPLDAGKFVAPTLIKYKTFDGAQIPAYYYRPAGAGPFPVVVYIHGGPESQARPRLSGILQYLLVEKKIAVVQPNVRGSRGYGKTYHSLDNGFKREDSVKDIGALLDWIAKQKELDANKVAVFGGSYGGYMVLASLVHFGKRLVAGVDVVGISNFVTFLTNTRAYRRDLRRAEYGDERDPKMRAYLEKISPATNANKIVSALFVAQGANDPRVPQSEAAQIVKAVRKTGKNVWYMLARNEGHGFRKKTNRDAFSLLFTMFLEKHLLQ